MNILESLGILGLAVALSAAVGFVKGKDYAEGKQATVLAKQVDDARRAEHDAAPKLFKLQEVKDAEDLRTTARWVAQLNSLRKRASVRLPVATPAACEGGTGTGLSGPDAGFLAGEAARANKLRTALQACYGWIETVNAMSLQASAPRP